MEKFVEHLVFFITTHEYVIIVKDSNITMKMLKFQLPTLKINGLEYNPSVLFVFIYI